MINGGKNGSVVTEAVTSVRNLVESATTEAALTVQERIIRFTGLEYFFFVALLGLSVFIGYYYGFMSDHKQNNTSEYIMGGRNMKILPIAMSLVASHVSGHTLLGLPVEVYSYGTQYIVFIVSAVVLGYALSYIFLPLFVNLQMTSSFQYLERRFGPTVRLVSSTIYIFKGLCFAPIVVYVPALALSQVTGYKLHLISPVICAVCVFYTTLGGLRAVVWTDLVQFVMVIGALIAVITLGTYERGGVSEVFAAASRGDRLQVFEFDPDPFLRTSFWTVSLGLTTSWIAAMGVGQTNLQRFLSVPTLAAARRAVLLFTVGMILIKVLTLFVGLCLYARYEHCDPVESGIVQKTDQILPFYVTDVGGMIPGLPGLFIAGIFATGLSSLSSSLNTLCGVIYDNFVKPFFPKATEAQASTGMKVIVCCLGIIITASVLVVEHLGSIFEMGVSITNLTSGTYLGIFTVGMTTRTANAKGVIIGSFVSISVVATILVGSKIHHVPQTSLLSVQTDQCDAHLSSSATTTNSSLPSATENNEVFWLFKLSFMYFALVGLIVMIVVTQIASLFVGGDPSDVDESLLLPYFQSKEYKKRKAQINITTKYGDVNQDAVELHLFSQKEESDEQATQT